MTARSVAVAAALLVVGIGVLLSMDGPGEPVTVQIPSGATLPDVAQILAERDIVRSARAFHVYARLARADRDLKAGTYLLETRSSVRSALRRLTRGEVQTVPLAIPEGFTIALMAPRIGEITGLDSATVRDSLMTDRLVEVLEVPGPTLEGYLFPDTYYFAQGVGLMSVATEMVERYEEVWTPERRALLEESGLSEREIVTLASIIQAEARHVPEMPRISGVYHNRLRDGWLLQADPTVLYALGGYRARLLYAAIDSVEDNPYNTYAHSGLPPGPIGSPGELAIDAALEPEEHDFMFFVANPDGTHRFTRSLREHNNAKEEAQAAR